MRLLVAESTVAAASSAEEGVKNGQAADAAGERWLWPWRRQWQKIPLSA